LGLARVLIFLISRSFASMRGTRSARRVALGAAIQFSLFTWALRWLPPSRVVIYLTLNPIVAILLASLFLGETVTPVLIAGLVFVIGGIFVANRRAAAAGAGDPQTPKP
jgi:threonine/homoserine efflux transporter RhtA